MRLPPRAAKTKTYILFYFWKKEKGGMVEEHFDTTIDLDIDAYLPETYVVSEEQRLDL